MNSLNVVWSCPCPCGVTHAVGSPSAAVNDAGSQSSRILILCPPSAALGVESASAPTTAKTPAVTADGTVLDHIAAPRAAAPDPGAALLPGRPERAAAATYCWVSKGDHP